MPYSQAHNKANQRYQEKAYDRLYIRVKKGKKEKYIQLAEKRGKSFAALVTDLLDSELEKENAAE